jgi:hypothetical protein
MKSKRTTAADADVNQAGRALDRAAARARKLAEETDTPLYVLKAGRIMDLNAHAAGAYVLREDGRRK